MRRIPIRALLAPLASSLIFACAKGPTTPAAVPATPQAQCQAAHDHVLALTDSAIPGDEDEVHDLISDDGQKDATAWSHACMSDQAKEAPCAIQATSFDAIDACNGSAARDHWTIRVGIGECAAMMAHLTDLAMSAPLEGGELDPETRQGIRQQIEQGITAEDMEACSKLSHVDVACFLAAREVKTAKSCGEKLAKDSPEFVSEVMELAGGNAPKDYGQGSAAPPPAPKH